MTMIETLLAVTLSVMIMLPIMGWAQFSFREQSDIAQRNIDSTGLSLLRTYLVRDVTSADSAVLSGAGFVDCVGGEGADGTLLLVLQDGAERTTYTRAPDTEGGTGLWRRTCATTGGTALTSVGVVSGLQDGGASIVCVDAVPGVGGSGGAPPAGTCRRLRMELTTIAGEQASVSATVRSDALTPDEATGPVFVSPDVVLTADPASSRRGMRVQFSSAGSMDPAGGPLTFFWEFGDGTTSTDADPTHEFTRLGRFTTVLTVSTLSGTPSTDFVEIEVGNRAPVAVIAAPASGTTTYRGAAVSFSSAGSSDGLDAPYGGTIVGYRWEFGDGTTSTDANPTASYANRSSGSGYVVRLTVTDNDGLTGTAQINVIVANRVPTVSIVTNRDSGPSPLSVTFTANVVDETTMSSNPPLTYAWNFGNGQTSTLANPAAVTYSGKGVRTVTLTVTDDAGATASDTHAITVNTLPTAAFTMSTYSGRAPRSATFSNTSTDSDGTINVWSWNFGDGTTSAVKTPPATTFTFDDPNSDTFVSATYTVSMTAADDLGGSSTATRSITVTGAPAPTDFRRTSSGVSGTTRFINFSWSAVSTVNRYQVDLVCVSCSDAKVQEITTTSGRVTGLIAGARNYTARIRARDTTTGKWGAWSNPITVTS